MSVYLDYNATTPVDPRVVEAMLPYFYDTPGNAASTDHAAGLEAQRAVEAARGEVAALIGAEPEEIVFTSGATEANNIALRGVAARAAPDAAFLMSAIEHPSVRECAPHLGREVTEIPVDASGVIDPEAIRAALSSRVAGVTVMMANNETGAIQPVEEIGAICAEAGVTFHTDAVQAGARLPIQVDNIGCGLLSLSAHKLYGPKGVGALYVRRRRPRPRLAPILFGGGHERNLRPGTLNVPAIVGFGVAARLVHQERDADAARERELRASLLEALATLGPVVHGSPDEVLPQTLSVRFPGVDARAVLRLVSTDLAVATGSACSTTSVEPSHVLIAQGLTERDVGETLRISLGRFTTEDEIRRAAQLLSGAVVQLRQLVGAQAA